MGVKAWITQTLQIHLHPTYLEVLDDSDRHKGHPGVSGTAGETHFRIRVQAASLEGLARLHQHRTIYALLKTPPQPIHALCLEILPSAFIPPQAPSSVTSTVQWMSSPTPLDYAYALDVMTQRVSTIASGLGPELIWLLEHPSFYSLGAGGHTHHLHANPYDIPVIHTPRGGQITYHGPGQLIGYVLLNLKERQLSPRSFVSNMEHWIQRVLERVGLKTFTDPQRIGVWTVDAAAQEVKVAAIGVKISKGVSSHGFALNLAPELKFFDSITPCGLAHHRVTSLEQLGIAKDREILEHWFYQEFANVFGKSLEAPPLTDEVPGLGH